MQIYFGVNPGFMKKTWFPMQIYFGVKTEQGFQFEVKTGSQCKYTLFSCTQTRFPCNCT